MPCAPVDATTRPHAPPGKGEAVRRELLPGTSTELLKELHLLTRAGDLNADSLRKLKQVNHLAGLLAPALDDVLAPVRRPRRRGLRRRQELPRLRPVRALPRARGQGAACSRSSRAPSSPGPARSARRGSASTGSASWRRPSRRAPVPERVHLVTALHACDTATDDALALAIRHGADHVAVVPCCQAEVARQLAAAKEPSPLLAPLFDHPWHRREFGSHLTNVVRALALEAAGYKVTVTELTGWEHSREERAHPRQEGAGRLARGQGAARRAPRRGGRAPEARPAPRAARTRDGRSVSPSAL